MPTQPITLGNMAPSLIDAVIKRHMQQFRYCYQRELNQKHDLSGKISVKFVIAADGSVAKASTRSITGRGADCLSLLFKQAIRMQLPWLRESSRRVHFLQFALQPLGSASVFVLPA